MAPAVCMLTETDYQIRSYQLNHSMVQPPYDAIIILGGGLNERGGLYPAQKLRIDDAIKLQASGQAGVIIVSGAYSYKAPTPPLHTEAETMRDYILSRGVPADKILSETDSRDTLGNFYFVKTQLLLPHNWHRLYVVASTGHLEERLRFIINKVLGPDYTADILKFTANDEPKNLEREHRSYSLLQEWLHNVPDGDHDAVFEVMQRNHPGYGNNTTFTSEQLNQLIG